MNSKNHFNYKRLAVLAHVPVLDLAIQLLLFLNLAKNGKEMYRESYNANVQSLFLVNKLFV